MPIPLKLSPSTFKQLFPDAKEGDKFQAEIEGSFAMGENGELEPSIDSLEGQSVSDNEAAEGEAMPEAPTPSAPEASDEIDLAQEEKSPMASKLKNDMISKLTAIRGDKVNDKYA